MYQVEAGQASARRGDVRESGTRGVAVRLAAGLQGGQVLLTAVFTRGSSRSSAVQTKVSR
jgi:hypothetical protein